jgi:hypothetical protein
MFKNWKTSLTGVLSALGQLLAFPVNSWRDLVLPIGTLLLGLFAKDNNVTGGNVTQVLPPKN